jgi:hypothetical protein
MMRDDKEFNSKMTLSYKGFGKDVTFSLDNNNADYLPKVVETFAQFLRSAGFVYVGVEKTPPKPGKTRSDYVIHSNYQWEDDEDLEDQNLDSLEKEEEDYPEEVNQAAHNYWDKVVGDYFSDDLKIGDAVIYNGRGSPDKDAKYPHAGQTGVSLKYKTGKIQAFSNESGIPRYLVKFTDWHDGHNGMGEDPDAKMREKNYWWVNLENISKVK